MKPQDILFFLALAFLLWKRNPKLTAGAGIICLIVSIPLFAMWIFFTAQRFTWYGAAFFLLAIILQLLEMRTKK